MVRRVRFLARRNPVIERPSVRKVRQLLRTGHLTRNRCQTVTDVTPDGTIDAQLEDTCRRGKCRGRERERQRWHVLDRCRSKGQEKTKTPGNVSPGESQSDNKSMRRSYPRKPVLPRESLGRPRDRSKVQSASGTVPRLCRSRKAGARRGRRGRRGNRAVPEPELQSRPSCERWRSPRDSSSFNLSTENWGDKSSRDRRGT